MEMAETARKEYGHRDSYEEFLRLSAGEGPDELIGGYIYRGDKLLDLPKQGHYTMEEFEKIRAVGWEFIDGEIIKMDAPGLTHQEILMALSVQFYAYLRGKTCKVIPGPFDVILGLDDYGDPVRVEPDLSVICDPEKIKGRDCQGAPDLIVEIASPSTRRIDRVKKLNWYRRFGVAEYWLVDPEEQIVEVLVLKDGNYYTTPYERTEKIKVHVLEDCEIDLSQVFPPAES